VSEERDSASDDVALGGGRCGLNIGGRFEEQRDLIWRLDAEFPCLSD
jgi:hypothetical protein